MIVDFVKAQKEDNIIEKAKFNLLFQLIFMSIFVHSVSSLSWIFSIIISVVVIELVFIVFALILKLFGIILKISIEKKKK